LSDDRKREQISKWRKQIEESKAQRIAKLTSQ
jgi:hypothetical protein